MITKALENGVQIYTNIILKNAVATIAVLSLITVLLLQSALTFEQNMTRDIEVYLPEGEESTEILIEVSQDWATDLIIVIIFIFYFSYIKMSTKHWQSNSLCLFQC